MERNIYDIYAKYPVIGKAINYLIANNPSNLLPYHDIDHMYAAFKAACDFLIYNDLIKMNSVNYSDSVTEFENINEAELLVAALFHDYNHSGGKFKDDVNVENAVKGLTEFHSMFPEFHLEIASWIIKCTQYPYVVEDKDLLPECMIMRDCDMCYMFDPIAIVKLKYGLKTELNVDDETFYNNQKGFIMGLTFYTDYFKRIWAANKFLRLIELEYLQQTKISV